MQLKSPLKIGDIITVYPDIDEIQVLKNGQTEKIKLEPRVMKVLLLLSKNDGAVVTREYFLEEIWENYEGADEALTQSISLLRKSINDTEKLKRIIETVPKKGYRLNLPVTEVKNSTTEFESKTTIGLIPANWKIWLVSLLFIFILLYIVILAFNSDHNTVGTAPLAPQTIQMDKK